MSEERKTKTDAAAPAPAALERIDRKDAFLQALHTFLTAHQGTEWAVAAVDIQHFKLYNELYGTEKGDALLETVANCLLGYSKQTGYPVGYFGNDDFFLCLPDEKAEQTAVLATLQACMAAGRQDVTFFVVMGVCPMQANPGADAATLCNYAQIAGVTTDSGYLHRFEPTMLNELKEQQQLLGELERALDNHEFCFFLQPKCNSITRAIVGMEALVRWNHPTRGCVPPAEFMPLLERTGLVTRLDQYIWESVCQTLQKWQESGSNLVPVSVNVSVQDILNLDVPQIFADLVEKYKLEPKLLLAEITETMVAEDTQMVESAIQGLHRKGFAVMMDDFGSGYSSLNMLKDTNVDAIKLDMKLIDMNQENRSKGVQIVESVVDMAHRLNLPIIAEGVETPEQVSMLQAADCLYSQGYYFFKPMPVENAEKLLADPTNQDYWDLRRDLMRRDRRVENPGTEKTALALQAYQIFTDNVLEISLLNLATGAYRVIKRDARLLGADLEKEEDFVNYCDRLVNEKIVHEEDADLFLEQTDLEALRSVLYHATAPEFYRYRENVSGQYIWVSTLVNSQIAQQTLVSSGKKSVHAIYEIKIPRLVGKYIIRVSMAGYDTTYADLLINKIHERAWKIDTQPIYISRVKSVHLDDVVVKATKVKFYHKGDTLVYNADAFQLAEGSMLDALIRQLPGAELRKDGQIYVNGKFVSTLIVSPPGCGKTT